MLGNSEVYKLTLFLLLTPIHLSVKAVKGIKDGREKDKDTFRLRFYWGFTTILWRGMFSWTSWNCWLPHTRHLKNIRESSFTNYKLRVCHVYPLLNGYIRQMLLLVGETQCTAKFRTQQTHALPTSSREKKVHLV